MDIKRNWLYAGGAVAIIALVAFFSLRGPTQYTDEEVLNINLAEHKSLAMHIHPKLTISILGEDYPIPTDIGISQTGMRVIHTHEEKGILHIESPVIHQFYLEDFFAIWGKRFTEQCIFEYCSDENHTLKVYVNGEESNLYGLVPLYDHDEIKIVYAENGTVS